MEYKKAVENYTSMISRLDAEIVKRQDKLQDLNKKVEAIKSGRKEEIEEGIFTNALKKFSKGKDLLQYSEDIQALELDIKAIQELKQGRGAKAEKSIKELIEAAHEEQERLLEESKAKDEAIRKAKEDIKKMEDEKNDCINQAKFILANTALMLSELIRSKYPNEFEKYYEKDNLPILMDRLIGR